MLTHLSLIIAINRITLQILGVKFFPFRGFQIANGMIGIASMNGTPTQPDIFLSVH
jgi:hypothetical protein